jgi:hypothetical protein
MVYISARKTTRSTLALLPLGLTIYVMEKSGAATVAEARCPSRHRTRVGKQDALIQLLLWRQTDHIQHQARSPQLRSWCEIWPRRVLLARCSSCPQMTLKHDQCISATSLKRTAIQETLVIVTNSPCAPQLWCQLQQSEHHLTIMYIYIYVPRRTSKRLEAMNDCLSWSASTLLGELCLCRLPLQDYISSYRPTHTPIYMSSAFCFKIVSKPAASEKEIKTCAESEGSWSRRISASPFSKTFAFSQLDLVTSALVNSRRCL